MENLQKLFDYYRDTKPTKGKLNDAANFLIHVCKALRVTMPEDVLEENFEEIPAALDEYFVQSKDKAIQDKSTFAEMIGRFGPINGWEKPYRKLLEDSDSNLRQFSLQVLEFCGSQEPELVIPYIEQTFRSKDLLMRNIAAILVGKLYVAGHEHFIQEKIQDWYELGNKLFIQEVYANVRLKDGKGNGAGFSNLKSWLQREYHFS